MKAIHDRCEHKNAVPRRKREEGARKRTDSNQPVRMVQDTLKGDRIAQRTTMDRGYYQKRLW